MPRGHKARIKAKRSEYKRKNNLLKSTRIKQATEKRKAPQATVKRNDNKRREYESTMLASQPAAPGLAHAGSPPRSSNASIVGAAPPPVVIVVVMLLVLLLVLCLRLRLRGGQARLHGEPLGGHARLHAQTARDRAPTRQVPLLAAIHHGPTAIARWRHPPWSSSSCTTTTTATITGQPPVAAHPCPSLQFAKLIPTGNRAATATKVAAATSIRPVHATIVHGRGTTTTTTAIAASPRATATGCTAERKGRVVAAAGRKRAAAVPPNGGARGLRAAAV